MGRVTAGMRTWNWLLGLGFGLEVSGQVIDTVPLIADLTGTEGADPGG